MKVWIVLPAYNEALALPPLLDSLIENMTEDGRKFEIVVVNDGSKDNTTEVLQGYINRSLPVRMLINDPNRGLAETIKRGLLEALGQADSHDIIITMDADNTHPAGLALRMIRLIREGNDVVIASRYREGSYIRGLSMFRRFLSFGASWLFRVVFPIRGVRDYTCGYRAYRVEALQELQRREGNNFIKEKGFACMVEILLSLRKLDLIFTEVPMVLRYDLKPGRSSMQVFKTIRQTLALLVRKRVAA
jgi:dolichol-phosphate mannosyltransferase